MKKFLTALVMLIVAMSSTAPNEVKAQATVLVTTTDTLTNTDTVTISLPTATGGYYAIGITALITSASITVTGYVQLEGSHTGSDWDSIGARMFFTTTARQHKAWAITPSTYQYHRVKFYSSGTVVAIPKVYYRLIRLLTATNNKPAPGRSENLAVLVKEYTLPSKLRYERKFLTA